MEVLIIMEKDKTVCNNEVIGSLLNELMEIQDNNVLDENGLESPAITLGNGSILSLICC